MREHLQFLCLNQIRFISRGNLLPASHLSCACALSQTAPLLSRRLVTRQWRLLARWLLVDLYLGVFDWKVQRFCWPKGTSLECAESIYVKIMEAACVSEELCRWKKKKKMDDSRIERARDRLLTVRPCSIASYINSLITWLFVSLEALKMYCVMRASAPPLHTVYRRLYDYWLMLMLMGRYIIMLDIILLASLYVEGVSLG